MPRTARAAEGGIVYHILNRGNNRQRIFHKPSDYAAFIKLLIGARQRAGVEVFGYCLMPNHWHLVLRPQGDLDLAQYMSWLTNTHVKRYRAHYSDTSGHLYQGRYKSFPIQIDEHFLTVLRYVEANALRASLVHNAVDWKWGSASPEHPPDLLSPWPVAKPQSWHRLLNEPQSQRQVEQIRTSIVRDRPFGSERWVRTIAKRMKLEFTLRPRGRPLEKGGCHL